MPAWRPRRASPSPRPAAPAPSSTRRARRRAGPGPASTWARLALGPDQPQEFDDRRARTVDVGNPHLVLLGPDTAGVDIAELGPQLQSAFAGGINVEWITVADGEGELLDLRVWERGVGETLACGTGQRGRRRRGRQLGRRCARRTVRVRNPGRDPRGHARGGRARPTSLPGRSGAQGGRRRHPPGNALLSSRVARDASSTHLPGADHPGRRGLSRPDQPRWSRRSSTSWRSWWTAPAPTSWAASCSGATPPTRPRSSGGARRRRSPR